MLECTSIIINSFHLFHQTIFNEGFVMEGGRGVLKERMKTNRGRGAVKPISMLTLRKIALFFKQQIEFLLISCLAVAKSFIKKA